MPYYEVKDSIWIDQDWINENADDSGYVIVDSRKVHDLIHELKYLRIHDDKSSLELLELLAERMES